MKRNSLLPALFGTAFASAYLLVPGNTDIPADPFCSTFSIVAFDSATGDVGISVQSKFPNVRPVVPWARAGVGAVATQSFANVSIGPRGLALM